MNATLKKLVKQALHNNDQPMMEALDLYINHPLFNWTPRPDNIAEFDQQHSYVYDRTKEVKVVLSGNAAGKSEASAFQVANYLLTTPPPRLYTPFWVISADYTVACTIDWGEKLYKFIPECFIEHISYYKKSTNAAESVTLKPHANGNRWFIQMRSGEAHPSSFAGASVGGLWFDEPVDHAVVTECLQRTRDYPDSLKLYSLTPVNHPCIELREIYETKNPMWKFYRMNSELNTAIDQSYYQCLLSTSLDEYKETRRTGAFASFAGQVYKHFDTKRHVCEPFDISSYKKFRAIDFGWSAGHYFAVIWLGVDNNGNYVVYREYKNIADRMEDHVKAINETEWKKDDPTYADYADAAARKWLVQHDIHTIPADKCVELGIAQTQGLFRDNKIKIFNNCKGLIRELQEYRWRTPKRGEWSHLNKPEPLKINDDCVDAMRYGLMTYRGNIDFKPVTLKQHQRKVFGR